MAFIMPLVSAGLVLCGLDGSQKNLLIESWVTILGLSPAFDGRPFQTRMLYNGNPWFLPLIIAWYGWKDRLGV